MVAEPRFKLRAAAADGATVDEQRISAGEAGERRLAKPFRARGEEQEHLVDALLAGGFLAGA
jgi:hypothetical protein